jgi:hypothetical protein
MDKQFRIRFKLPLERSLHIISLEAIAELHHSSPYYVIQSFNYPDHSMGNHVSFLPEQKIRKIREGDTFKWVHTDSNKETQLSIAIGEAIDQTLQMNNDTAEYEDNTKTG